MSVTGAPAGALDVGVDVHDAILELPAVRRRELLARVAERGLNHVCVADHVSFHGGGGFDGMVSAAAALTSHDELDVWITVYQLALRHPLVVARQLASLAQIGPGRVLFGVGVGGEDRSEVSNCGVDPATRGRRIDEELAVLAALEGGEPVDHDGAFFALEQARILPPPDPRIPVIIGGSSEAAIRRTARFGDGFLGIFVSPRRFGATVEEIRTQAAAAGRQVDWFGMNVWCGVDPDPAKARQRLGSTMEALYHLPYEKFERVAPAGTAEDIARWLVPFVEAGARNFNLIPAADEPEQSVDAAAEVGELLAGMV